MANNLDIALQPAIMLRIMELKAKGGPSEEDYKSLPAISQLLGEKGDLLMFKGKKAGESAEVFNQVVRGIAILAFAPGGITIFGEHYDESSM